MSIKNIPIILAIVVLVVVFLAGWQRDRSSVENIEVKCTLAEREADVCIEIYQPVCASVSVECIKAPCNSVKQTFTNSCKACGNSRVESYVPGECLSE